jgi:hypothetical protein
MGRPLGSPNREKPFPDALRIGTAWLQAESAGFVVLREF